jgi:polygalacturonase
VPIVYSHPSEGTFRADLFFDVDWARVAGIEVELVKATGDNPTPTPTQTATPTPTQTASPTPTKTVTPEPATGPVAGAPAVQCSASGAVGATRTARFPVQGAAPDDSVDDYRAIQSAINRAGAAGGGVVSLPAGTFLINGHLLMKSGVRLQGAGPRTVIKAGPGFLSRRGTAGGYPVISTDGARDVTIADLTADQSGDVLNGNVNGRLSEYLVDVRRSRNAVVSGVHTRNPFTYSIAATGSSNFCIRHSSTRSETDGRYNQLDGIHILNSSYGDVVGNTVDQRLGTDGDDGLVAHTMGGSVHDIRYVGNKVRGGRHGAGMQLAYTNSTDRIYNLTIQNNEFWGSPSGIHTGTYGNPGSSSRITIGGDDAEGNLFRDNSGNAVNFTGSLAHITVTGNRACRSGTFKVGPGNGNVVKNNTTTC